MLNGAWYAQQFRDLADEFARLGDEHRAHPDDDQRAVMVRELELRDRGGGLQIDAIRHGVLLGVPGLQERVEWHTAPEDASAVRQAKLVRSPANLFWEVCGNHLIPMKDEAGTVRLLGPEPSGVLPTAFPNQLPPPRCVTFPATNDSERQKLRRFIDEFTLGNFARACRLLAELAESGGDGLTDTGIRLDGVEYTLPLDTRRIVHAAWGRRGHSLKFIDAEDVHGKEITPGIAKRIQRNFNDKVTNSRWQMSLAGEQFTIQRIEEDVE